MVAVISQAPLSHQHYFLLQPLAGILNYSSPWRSRRGEEENLGKERFIVLNADKVGKESR